jgi:hypothetical protein
MFNSYLYPFYRSWYMGVPYGGPYYNYEPYYSNVSNIVGSAVANQSMNTIGAGAIGGIQVATPTAIW